MTTIRPNDPAALTTRNERVFETHLQRARMLAYATPDGAKEAKKDQTAPGLADYTNITVSDNKKNVTYTTRDGQSVIVHRDQNPQLYRSVVEDHFLLQAQQDGYFLSIDNNDQMDYNSVLTSESIDMSHADEGIITFSFAANKRVLSESRTPDAFKRVKAKAEEAPLLSEYQQIDPPKGDTITFTKRDGTQTTVDRTTNPELFKGVYRDYLTVEAQKSGYNLDLDNSDQLLNLDFNDPSKVDMSHAADGVITFKFGVNMQFLINRRVTPLTFARLEALDHLRTYKDHGKIATPSQELPVATSDYKSLKVLEKGVLAVETQDGQKYIVADKLTPQLFQQLEGIKNSKATLAEGAKAGYEAVTALPKPLDPNKLQIDSIDETSGVIQFHYDGKQYQISPQDAYARGPADAATLQADPGNQDLSTTLHGSELYKELFDASQLKGTPGEQALKDASTQQQNVVNDQQPLFKLADIESIDAPAAGVLYIKLKSGVTEVVIEQKASQSFAAYSSYDKTLGGIAWAQQNLYRLADPSEHLSSTADIKEMGWQDEYGPGLITYVSQKPGGGEDRVVVSKDLNPTLFEQVSSQSVKAAASPSELDELRAQHHLPAQGETSVDSLATDQKDEDGNVLTVEDLAMQNMINGYREGVKNGSIGEDDPRAKLVLAIEAKGATVNGLSVIPEHSVDTLFLGPGDPQTLTGRDVRDQLFDTSKIDKTIADSFSNETIQTDMQRFQTDARSHVVGGQERIDQTKAAVETMANSDDFRRYIQDLKDNDKGDVAETEVQRTYYSLMEDSPEKADKFLQDLSRDGMIMDLDKIMADPSKVSPENAAMAGGDIINFVLRGMRATGDLPSHLINAYETSFQKAYQNKSTAADIDKVWQDLGGKAKAGALTDADIHEAFNKTETFKENAFSPLSATEKKNVISMFTTMKDAGVLGSISGTMGLIRGIYQLVGNPGNLAKTAQGRLVIASDFVTFLSFSNGFATLGSKTYDHIFNTHTNEKLGLSKSVPELLWGKDPGLPPSGQYNAESKLNRALSDSFWNDVAENGAGANPLPAEEAAKKANTPLSVGSKDQKLIDGFARGIREGAGAKYTVSGASALRIAGSVSRVLGAGGDLAGGIIGVVLGGFGIRDGIKSGDDLQVASGSLGVIAGAASTVAGLSSINSALGLVSVAGVAGRVISFAGPVGFIIGTVLSFVGVFLNIARNNKLYKISHQNFAKIQQFDKAGLLKPGGQDTYVWLQTYLNNFGQRDAPTDQSIFDYRADEWNRRETHRSADHKDYEGDGLNAWSTEFPEQSSGNLVQ